MNEVCNSIDIVASFITQKQMIILYNCKAVWRQWQLMLVSTINSKPNVKNEILIFILQYMQSITFDKHTYMSYAFHKFNELYRRVIYWLLCMSNSKVCAKNEEMLHLWNK